MEDFMAVCTYPGMRKQQATAVSCFNKKGEMCSGAEGIYPVFSQTGLQNTMPMRYGSPSWGWLEAYVQDRATAEDIAAIGITNQRETAIVWDKYTGDPVYHATVAAERTSEYCDSLKEKD